MKQIIKNNIKYLIFLTAFGLVGGFFTGIYTVQILAPDMLEVILSEIESVELLYVIIMIQSAGYALICGILGKIISKHIGLWRKFELSRKEIVETVLVAVLGGVVFIMADHLFFNNFSETIKNSYALKPTIEYIIATITYGGVVEEIMLRLFLMSLVALLIQKLGNKEKMSERILVIANIISALLFAAAHLPATVTTIGITPMIVFRCFLMNGGFGLLFGRLYRKYGIHYAMIAHAGVHIVSKIIWILFI